MTAWRRIRRGSIAAEITTVTTLVSGTSVLLACLAFAGFDRTTFTEVTIRRLSMQAQIVGANSVSALLFNDPQTAEVTLGALSAAPNILSAEIYTPDGHSFARYQRGDSDEMSLPPALAPNQSEISRLDGQEIALVRRITFEGKDAGHVAIRSDLRELDARRAQYLRMIGVVLVTSLAGALLMSWLAQRAISRPIVHLAGIASRVSEDRDYSVRAETASEAREIVVLTDSFNTMLGQIQRQDRSLHEAQQALEGRVLERTAELDAVNKELEAFSYSVSHDLRAPLRHVIGFATLLGDHVSAQLDDRSKKYLTTITEAAERMGRLIDDLLAFSRMGRHQLTKRRLKLNDIVREAQHEVSGNGSVGPQVEWCVDDLPEIDGDPAMLRLVMVNLLSNAIKYSSKQPAPRIQVGSSGSGPRDVVVFVRDNGVGFDMQYVHKLFGVFQRLHRSEEFEGTGIGLANVRRIIHRHGGRVWAESQINHGATFYFSLPMTGQLA